MPLNVFAPFTLIEAEKLNENFTFVQTGLTDIAVTGAVTLVSSSLSSGPATLQWHVCTGTTTNYTVTLPAVSGNDGKYFAVRMSPLLTKLVTLSGNGNETINGSTTRIMHHNETAVLYCDGTQWLKVAGISLPMRCQMALPSVQFNVAPNGVKVNITTINIDTTGLMADSTNSRIYIRRGGQYTLTAKVQFHSLSTNSIRIISFAFKNSTASVYYSQAEGYGAAGGFPTPSASSIGSFATGDYLELIGFHSSSNNEAFGGDGTSSGSILELREELSW